MKFYNDETQNIITPGHDEILNTRFDLRQRDNALHSTDNGPTARANIVINRITIRKRNYVWYFTLSRGNREQVCSSGY